MLSTPAPKFRKLKSKFRPTPAQPVTAPTQPATAPTQPVQVQLQPQYQDMAQPAQVPFQPLTQPHLQLQLQLQLPHTQPPPPPPVPVETLPETSPVESEKTPVAKDTDYAKFKLEQLNNANIDLKLVYTPHYFSHLGLSAKISGSFPSPGLRLKGGADASNDTLSIPYRYFAFLIKNNPISTAIGNINARIRAMFEPQPQAAPPALATIFERPQPVASELLQEPATPVSSTNENTPQNTEDPTDEQLIIAVKLKNMDNDENGTNLYEIPNMNGKSLHFVLDTYATTMPATVETFAGTNITYNIVKRIISDICVQMGILLDELNLVVPVIEDRDIYVINERHVIITNKFKYVETAQIPQERTANSAKIVEFAKKLTSNYNEGRVAIEELMDALICRFHQQ